MTSHWLFPTTAFKEQPHLGAGRKWEEPASRIRKQRRSAPGFKRDPTFLNYLCFSPAACGQLEFVRARFILLRSSLMALHTPTHGRLRSLPPPRPAAALCLRRPPQPSFWLRGAPFPPGDLPSTGTLQGRAVAPDQAQHCEQARGALLPPATLPLSTPFPFWGLWMCCSLSLQGPNAHPFLGPKIKYSCGWSLPRVNLQQQYLPLRAFTTVYNYIFIPLFQ